MIYDVLFTDEISDDSMRAVSVMLPLTNAPRDVGSTSSVARKNPDLSNPQDDSQLVQHSRQSQPPYQQGEGGNFLYEIQYDDMDESNRSHEPLLLQRQDQPYRPYEIQIEAQSHQNKVEAQSVVSLARLLPSSTTPVVSSATVTSTTAVTDSSAANSRQSQVRSRKVACTTAAATSSGTTQKRASRRRNRTNKTGLSTTSAGSVLPDGSDDPSALTLDGGTSRTLVPLSAPSSPGGHSSNASSSGITNTVATTSLPKTIAMVTGSTSAAATAAAAASLSSNAVAAVNDWVDSSIIHGGGGGGSVSGISSVTLVGPSNSSLPSSKQGFCHYCCCCCGTVMYCQAYCHSLCRTSKSTIMCMNVLAKIVLWCTFVALAAAVIWYSYELFNHGTDPHLIAWFSAGAFVLLGFPISMWGIISHLANYNQPHVQQYIVRILWMVPIYSIESWLAMRFHKHAIYIETLRDFYESYVLYSFLQFLIQVLGGEEALILMLKDKSPTRGFHMWGLQWCVKPWLMGQPVRRVYEEDGGTIRRVEWTSPFFIKCKFGVLQYVLLKFLCAIAVLVLEWKGWYKEGKFQWNSGYLYICILTNLSQCWALYCLIFFYYATHTELSPIRPVGKFLSVKALVFFTWWQSVVIAILYQMDMIPNYAVSETNNWTPEDVAKGIQDYLICIEMFLAAVVHTFVFPVSEYSPKAVEARVRALNQVPMMWNKRKRLGRQGAKHGFVGAHGRTNLWRDDGSKSSGMGLELTSVDSGGSFGHSTSETAGLLASSQQQQQPLLGHQLQPPTHLWEDPAMDSLSLPRSRINSADTPSLSIPRMGDEETGIGGIYLSTVEDMSNEEDEERTSPNHHSVASSDLRRPFVSEHHAHDEDDEEGDEEDEGDSRSEEDSADDDDANTHQEAESIGTAHTSNTRTGFVRALIDSAIPRDLRDNTVGIVTGEYSVEKKTLLHHAATSDSYDLFSPNRRPFRRKTDL